MLCTGFRSFLPVFAPFLPCSADSEKLFSALHPKIQPFSSLQISTEAAHDSAFPENEQRIRQQTSEHVEI